MNCLVCNTKLQEKMKRESLIKNYMPNPFPTQFNSQCQDCFDTVEEGESMFAHEGQFICESCAEHSDLVCRCGNYKKEEFKNCYTCHEDEDDEEVEDENGITWQEIK